MKVKNIYLLVGLVLLVLAIFAITFFVYSYFFSKNNSDIGDSALSLYEAPKGTEDPPITPFRDLNEKILLLPQSTASASEKKEYIAFVSKYASAQNTVEIEDCKPKPLVIWVKSGSEITIKNLDSSGHAIEVNSSHNLNVPKNSSAKLKADFGQGPGVYAYSCDDSQGPVGIFLVASE